MSTIAENNSSMTIFYSKNTGKLQTTCSGIADMSLFGDDEDDYNTIWNLIVLPKDNYVLSNTNNFQINLETTTLELKKVEMPIYPVATQ